MKRRKPIACWISACRRKTCRTRAGQIAQRGGGGAVAAPMRRRGRRPIEAPGSAAPNRSGDGAPASPHRRLGSQVAIATRTTSRGQRRGMAKRILVAEDDPDNRCIVVKVPTLEGYETLEADNGRSALALARRERPDLIVMDLGMPGMDGWEAARRLKADPQTADIPIIALTAWDEERAREAGCCNGYLSKP